MVQGQLEGLACLFILLMIFLFLSLQALQGMAARVMVMSLIFASAILSCGTKEIAIIGPVLLLLVDWFFVAGGAARKLMARVYFHGALAVTVFGSYLYLLKPSFFINALGLKMEAQNNIGNIITQHVSDPITPFHYFISQFKVIIHYLMIFLWPFDLSVEYDWKLVEGFAAPDCIGPLFLLLFLAITIFLLLRRNSTHMIAFGLLWFALSIAPRSTIIPSCELIVDYKTYIASAGWLFIIAAGLVKACEFLFSAVSGVEHSLKSYGIQYALLLLLSLPLGIGTVNRNEVWSSGLLFWGDIITKAPNKARGYNNYGVELSQNCGKYQESIPYFEHAIKLDEHYRDPYNNLAVAYAATKDLDKAIAALRKSLKIHPYYPEAYNNIASFLLEKDEYAQAEIALDRAIKLRPYYGKAHFNRGRMYYNQGKHEQAWESFRKCCIEADLDNEVGFCAFGKISMVQKKFKDAIMAYERVLGFNPHNEEALFNSANAYFLDKQFEKAAGMYEKLIQQNPHDSRIYYNLAETYYALEKTKVALHYFEKVKSSSQRVMPQLYVRMASCHEKLGEPMRAEQMLVDLLGQDIPADVKRNTRALLAQFSKKYEITA